MQLWQTLSLISAGAAAGATLRWLLGLAFNPFFSALSFGTLIANYLGCFVIGLLLALFWQYPQISQGWKLFLVTGLLGSLTTFSSFSAEVIENLFNEKWLNAINLISLHLFGSLLCTLLGVLLYKAFAH